MQAVERRKQKDGGIMVVMNDFCRTELFWQSYQQSRDDGASRSSRSGFGLQQCRGTKLAPRIAFRKLDWKLGVGSTLACAALNV